MNYLSNTNIGTGLGLAICKSIAEKLHIEVNIDSEYSKGTEIYLLLNLSESENKSYFKSLSNKINNISNENQENIESFTNNENYGSMTPNIIIYPEKKSMDSHENISEIENNNLHNGKIQNLEKEKYPNFEVKENNNCNLSNSSLSDFSPNIRKISGQINISFVDSYIEEMQSTKNNPFNSAEKGLINRKLSQHKVKRYYSKDNILTNTNINKLTLGYPIESTVYIL